MQSRNERLAADYREMLKLQDRPYLSWIVTKGEPPYAEEYLLTVKIRTYALCAVSGGYAVGTIRRCTVRVTLWDSYPHVAPKITMLSTPPVFHPDWYSKGAYCALSPWRAEDSLKDYVKRMIATLCCDPYLTDNPTPANYKALDWFIRNRENADLFPSDAVELTENTPQQAAALDRSTNPLDEIVDSWTNGS